jgi:hypothetical protein
MHEIINMQNEANSPGGIKLHNFIYNKDIRIFSAFQGAGEKTKPILAEGRAAVPGIGTRRKPIFQLYRKQCFPLYGFVRR